MPPVSDGSLGAGVEFKPASNWIFGLEYLYYRFDNTDTGGGSWTFPNGQPAPFYNSACVAGQNCAKFFLRRSERANRACAPVLPVQLGRPARCEVLISSLSQT